MNPEETKQKFNPFEALQLLADATAKLPADRGTHKAMENALNGLAAVLKKYFELVEAQEGLASEQTVIPVEKEPIKD